MGYKLKYLPHQILLIHTVSFFLIIQLIKINFLIYNTHKSYHIYIQNYLTIRKGWVQCYEEFCQSKGLMNILKGFTIAA